MLLGATDRTLAEERHGQGLFHSGGRHLTISTFDRHKRLGLVGEARGNSELSEQLNNLISIAD